MGCAIRSCVRKCTAWPDSSRSRRGAVFHAVAAGVTPDRSGAAGVRGKYLRSSSQS